MKSSDDWRDLLEDVEPAESEAPKPKSKPFFGGRIKFDFSNMPKTPTFFAPDALEEMRRYQREVEDEFHQKLLGGDSDKCS